MSIIYSTEISQIELQHNPFPLLPCYLLITAAQGEVKNGLAGEMLKAVKDSFKLKVQVLLLSGDLLCFPHPSLMDNLLNLLQSCLETADFEP